MSQADFEAGYRKYVERIVADLPASSHERDIPAAEVRKRLAKTPNDPQLLARQALDHLDRKNYAQARRSADEALAIAENEQLANYVRARLHLLVGENREALARLERALDREHPQASLLGLLAGLKLKADDYTSAGELYALGASQHPGEVPLVE